MKRALSIATAILLLAGCEKEKSESGTKPNSPTPPANSTVKTAAAPVPGDLSKYTEGLTGTGQLMVKFSTNHGDIHCELFEEKAPLTVANFVGLARGLHPFKNPANNKVVTAPFFDGLTFHRVIPSFMIQGGDPLGRGTGGPGYKFATETHPDLRHDKPGILSMANAGPNTNGSQFFITETPQPRLDGSYNVFGQCQEIDIVGKIARVPKAGSKPREKVVMEKVEIFRDDFSKYEAKPFSE